MRLATALSATLVLALSAMAARAGEAPRPLTLADAVDWAITNDLSVTESRIVADQSSLRVLRAQLDRVTIKVDAQLQELWNKSNIGGSSTFCSVGGQTLPVDGATCAALGGNDGTSVVQGNFNVKAQVAVPLFSGFRVTATVKRAQLAEQSAGVAIRQAVKDTALAVARAYWSVRRVDLRRAVQAAQLERLRESEGIIEARVRAGLAPAVDVNRARARRLQQEASVADLDGQAREALAQLAVSLGIAGEVVLVDAPSLPRAGLPSVEELLVDARSDRQEIKTARLQLAMQHENVRIAQSSWYPQLTAFGAFQYGNNPFVFSMGSSVASSTANPFGNLAGTLTLGATLNVNLFDTLNTWSATKDAKFEEARLAQEERRSVRLVESDVRTAHARLLHLSAMQPPLVAASEAARDNVAILEGRYKNGDALVIEYLDAQNDLAGVETQLADLSAQLQVAWYELGAALGQTVGRGGAATTRSTSPDRNRNDG